MLYETLLADTDGILDVRETELEYGLKGLYCDGRVWIDKDMTCTDKACVLAEEIGHHVTSAGNILDQTDIRHRKQELVARAWAYRLLIPVEAIIEACLHGVRCVHELSEELGVTEHFTRDALTYYRAKHGLYAVDDRYLLYFDPLRVEERSA